MNDYPREYDDFDNPKIEDFDIDAYGHMSYGVGFWQTDDEQYDEERGDWQAYADFDADSHPDFVAYHVVYNTESGGAIETIEEGVLSREEAELKLPSLLSYFRDVAADHADATGHWFTDDEDKQNDEVIAKWEAAVAKALLK